MELEEISDPSVVTLPKMLIHEHLRDTERPSILGAITHLRRMDSIKKLLSTTTNEENDREVLTPNGNTYERPP